MKKYIYLILSLLLIPIMVNAETLTYEVCESGCEYASLSDVETAIRNVSNITDKDIVINVNSDMNSYLDTGYYNMANSVTVNGNNHDFNNEGFTFAAKKIEINNCSNLRAIDFVNSAKINLKNSNIKAIFLYYMYSNGQIKSEEINLTEVLEIDETSKNNLKLLLLAGNFKIENVNFKNILLEPTGGTINVYNSQIEKIFSYPMFGNITINTYNSKYNSLKYKNLTSHEEYERETSNMTNELDFSSLKYDIYDMNFEEWNGQRSSNTTVYFDKEAKLKPGDKINLVDYLDYYIEDKEIEYTIEDESIARIENKELIGLKEGSTNVTVTTDEGHVVYRINLVVEKETLPEKIDKMTIKVPITGSKIKLWVLIVGGVLLGIIGTCLCMLIKRKK